LRAPHAGVKGRRGFFPPSALFPAGLREGPVPGLRAPTHTEAGFPEANFTAQPCAAIQRKLTAFSGQLSASKSFFSGSADDRSLSADCEFASKRVTMELLIFVLIIVGWFVLQKYILPKCGIST